MSEESPDVPEAPAEAGAGEQAAPDQPDVQEAGDSGGELDIAALPPQAQEYIRELREEAKSHRKAAEPLKHALSHFNQAEQEYLIGMVDKLGTDQDVGAQAMLNLSQKLLGIEAAAEEAASDPEAIAEAEASGISEQEYRQIVKEEMENEQRIASIVEETKAAGFDPDEDEEGAEMLWSMALALGEDDLASLAPLVRQRLGRDEPAGEAAPAVEEAPAAQFPVTAGINSGVADTNPETQREVPRLDSQELRDRVTRKLQGTSPG